MRLSGGGRGDGTAARLFVVRVERGPAYHVLMTFNCWSCKKDSRLVTQAMRLLTEFKTPKFGDEKRRYNCEHCGEENSITMSAAEWMQLDFSENSP